MILKYQHYFQALPPKIPVEKLNKWFQHPWLEAEVNEFGEVRSTDPGQEFYDMVDENYYGLRHTKGLNKGKYRKTAFLFCCYHQVKKAPRYIFYLDGNPYNLTKSNLIGINYAPPDLISKAMENTHSFIRNTIQEIPKYIQKYERFWCAEDTIHNLKIPAEYMEYFRNPDSMEKNFELNQKSLKRSIRTRIYRLKNIDYGF